MIAVIFEVEPAEGRFDDYLDHAARLRKAGAAEVLKGLTGMRDALLSGC